MRTISSRRRSQLCRVVALFAAVLAPVAPASAQTALTPELDLGGSIVGDQVAPDVAMDATGRFFVVWAHESDTGPWEIHAASYAPAGTVLVPPRRVNLGELDSFLRPPGVVLPPGEPPSTLVAFWRDQAWRELSPDDLGGLEETPREIRDLALLTPSTQAIGYKEWVPDQGAGASGHFEMMLQFQAGTLPPGEPMLLARERSSENDSLLTDGPRVVRLGDDEAWVAWREHLTLFSYVKESLHLQLVAEDGSRSAISTPLQREGEPYPGPQGFDVAVTADGLLVAAWATHRYPDGTPPFDHTVKGIEGVLVGPDATVLATFEIPIVGDDVGELGIVAAEAGLVVAWDELDGASGEWSVFGQALTSTGVLRGDRFAVSVGGSTSAMSPRIATDGGHRLVVVWQGSAVDGDGTGVTARLLEIDPFADGFESGDLSAWSVAAGSE